MYMCRVFKILDENDQTAFSLFKLFFFVGASAGFHLSCCIIKNLSIRQASLHWITIISGNKTS